MGGCALSAFFHGIYCNIARNRKGLILLGYERSARGSEAPQNSILPPLPKSLRTYRAQEGGRRHGHWEAYPGSGGDTRCDGKWLRQTTHHRNNDPGDPLIPEGGSDTYHRCCIREYL